jgi:uncharacterized membrane protein
MNRMIGDTGVERGRDEAAPDGTSRLQGALAYALAGFSGVVLLVLRREDRFVQFHSLQSIAATLAGLAVWLLLWLFSFFPLVGFLYGMLLGLFEVVLFVTWLYLLWQAYHGRWVHIPYLGAWVERQVL